MVNRKLAAGLHAVASDADLCFPDECVNNEGKSGPGFKMGSTVLAV